MEHKLKMALPNFTINNSSNRDINQLLRITEICHKIDNLIVLIERNEKNEDYFRLTELTQNTTEINLIFLNKDDIYYYFIENNNYDITIMSFKRRLLNEIECVVCMEKCINKFYLCCKCGHQIHKLCFEKCTKQICSICKYNHFMFTE
jgi:hypothetical protein